MAFTEPCTVGAVDPEIGKSYGRLLVLATAPRRGNHKMLLCRCSCGVEAEYFLSNLKKGNSKGCRTCSDAARRGVAVTHGMSSTGMYNAYRTMISRCSDPNHIQYADYGGRGITVCQRWAESFENFLEDMGERPVGLSLERNDNSLGYCKENCSWATRKRQARNKRTTLWLTSNGVTKSLQDWAEELVHHPKKLVKRLKLGWSHERILGTP